MKNSKFIWVCLLVVTVLSLASCNKTDYFKTEEPTPEVQEEPGFDKNAELIVEGKTTGVPNICEITLDHMNIAKDIKPKDPGTVYSQYSAADGKVYVDLCMSYKNLDTAAVSAYDTMKCTLVYADKYEYSGFSAMEIENRTDFESSRNVAISPLSTEFVHYLFEVPDEVRTGGEKIDLYLTVSGKNFRLEADPEEIDITSLEVHPGENAVEVKAKELITTANSEFSISNVVVTNDVLPREPGDYYSHFEAEPGKLIADLCLIYKNTSSTKIGVDSIGKATLVLDNRYEYAGFTVAEKNDGTEFLDADVTSILPLETGYVHQLFMVPEEIRAGNEPVDIVFTIDGTEYKYKLR